MPETNTHNSTRTPPDSSSVDPSHGVLPPLNVERPPLIDKILTAAIEQNVSDIHLVADTPPIFRKNGSLIQLPTNKMSSEALLSTFRAIAGDANWDQVTSVGGTDFSFVFPSEKEKGKKGIEPTVFRANACNVLGGIKAVLRLVPKVIPEPAELGIPEVVCRLALQSKGLFLVTGPTGSGKSTTLHRLSTGSLVIEVSTLSLLSDLSNITLRTVP